MCVRSLIRCHRFFVCGNQIPINGHYTYFNVYLYKYMRRSQSTTHYAFWGHALQIEAPAESHSRAQVNMRVSHGAMWLTWVRQLLWYLCRMACADFIVLTANATECVERHSQNVFIIIPAMPGTPVSSRINPFWQGTYQLVSQIFCLISNTFLLSDSLASRGICVCRCQTSIR